MELPIDAAKQKGLEYMDGMVLNDNVAMRKLARTMGFEIQDKSKVSVEY